MRWVIVVAIVLASFSAYASERLWGKSGSDCVWGSSCRDDAVVSGRSSGAVQTGVSNQWDSGVWDSSTWGD